MPGFDVQVLDDDATVIDDLRPLLAGPAPR
jgi:hypothetical protein